MDLKTLEKLENVLASFLGEITQVPPIYSSVLELLPKAEPNANPMIVPNGPPNAHPRPPPIHLP